MYQKNVLLIIHRMEDNLKIFLEEVDSNEIHCKGPPFNPLVDHLDG
jgi:hypothetical protein